MSFIQARRLIAPVIGLYVCALFGATPINADASNPFYGYWDEYWRIEDIGHRENILGHVNVGMDFDFRMNNDPSPLTDGLDVITRLGQAELDADEARWTQIINHRKNERGLTAAGASTRMILLMDEPYLKGYTTEQLEMIIDVARSVLDQPEEGIFYKFGYTMTRGNLLHSNMAMPQNADFLGINHYPFALTQSGNPRIGHTHREFDADTQQLLSIMRDRKALDTQIFLVGQAFYGQDSPTSTVYVPPPVESPLWYADVVRNNSDVAGLLWFEYVNRHTRTGTVSMPDLLENQKLAYQLILSGPDPDPDHSGPYVINRSRGHVYFESGGFETSMAGQAPREGDPHIGWWATVMNDVTVVDADEAGFEAFTGTQFLRLQDSAAGRPQLSSEAVARGSAGDVIEIGLALRVEEGILRIRVRNEDGNSFLDPLFHADGTIEGRYGGAANPPPPGFDAYERFVLTQTLNIGEWNTVIMRYTLGEMDAFMSVNGGAFESMGAPDPGNQFRFINFRSEGNVAMVAYIDAIPEPASVFILGLAGLGLIYRRHRAR